MTRRAELLTFGIMLQAAVIGEPTAVANESNRWVSLDRPGIELREIKRSALPGDVIYELRINLSKARLALVQATDFKARSKDVGELVTLSRCVAAVNGGYFDGNERPLGYQRDSKHVVCADIATGNAFTGVFVLGRSGPGLLSRNAFSPGAYDFAIQCGPRLVANGRRVPGIATSPARRRTGIGYDRSGRVFLYATGPSAALTFAECQAILCGPAEQGGLDPVGVLNLDGGSSTQFSVHTRSVCKDVPGLTPVPVAVAVLAK